MSIQTRKNFTGSNNIAKPERLPDGNVVDAVNIDFTVGGKAELRVGFSKVMEGDNIRAVFSHGDSLIVADGPKLLRHRYGVTEELRTNLPLGPISAVEHNGFLYVNTVSDSFKIGTDITPWAIPEPSFAVRTVSGNMVPGIYRVAVTSVIDGRESGCVPATVHVLEGQALEVSVFGGPHKLYCSSTDGLTLYSQGYISGVHGISSPVDDTDRLTTAFLSSLPFCINLTSHDSLILGSAGSVLFHTTPMLPHLCDMEKDHFSFPSEITLVASVDGGIYVCAGKTYFLSNFGSGDQVKQRVVAEFGAVSGSGVSLPDGSVAWFSKYGQVIGRADGVTEFINKASYSPDIASTGAAGLLEHNGNQMVVTTMRGEQSGSNLRSADHWELEVV